MEFAAAFSTLVIETVIDSVILAHFNKDLRVL